MFTTEEREAVLSKFRPLCLNQRSYHVQMKEKLTYQQGHGVTRGELGVIRTLPPPPERDRRGVEAAKLSEEEEEGLVTGLNILHQGRGQNNFWPERSPGVKALCTSRPALPRCHVCTGPHQSEPTPPTPRLKSKLTANDARVEDTARQTVTSRQPPL